MYVQTVHYVHTLASQSQRWDAAAMYGETILPAFRSVNKILKYFCHLQIFSPRLYYGHSTGVVAGLLVRLGQALAETGSEARAQKLFSEADRIYRIVPGVHHPFYTEVCKIISTTSAEFLN